MDSHLGQADCIGWITVRAPWSGPQVYEVGQDIATSCLREDGSLFSPGRPIWTLGLSELLEGRVGAEEPSTGTFIEKLKAQLVGVEPDGIQLAAELLFVQLLAEGDVNAELKLEHIDGILALAPGHATVPDPLKEALGSGGVASYGAGKAFRDAYLRFLVRFLTSWKEQDGSVQEQALSDPWSFLPLVEKARTSTDAMTANALLHLIFPETFEYIIAPKDRGKFLTAFASAPGVAEVEGDNQKIARIRSAATDALGRDVDFYENPFKRIWREDTSPAWKEMVEWASRLYARDDFDEVERDYKLELAHLLQDARTSLEEDGEWLAALKRALTAKENNLLTWRTSGAFLEWSTAHPEETRALLTAVWQAEDRTVAIEDFLAAVPKDAVSGQGTRISLASYLLMGTDAKGSPFYKPSLFRDLQETLQLTPPDTQIDPETTYRPGTLAKTLGVSGRRIRAFLRETHPRESAENDTDWLLTGEQAEDVVERFGGQRDPTNTINPYLEWVELLEEFRLRMLGDGVALRDLLDAQSIVYWIVQGPPPEDWSDAEKKALLTFRAGPEDEGGEDGPQPDGAELNLRRITAEVTADLHLPEPWLQEIVDLLRSKRQLIFYGPPGTGKTFVAQRLGEHLASNGGAMRLVQFHPSYTYEDFFEGYRPERNDGGAIAFELVPGVLRELAKQAALNPDTPHVLVIDEINRGNIAKIFGELYYLLEYRNKTIQLQYSRAEDFSVPENLLVIGTMNTADRSIALVDGALRRRFNFVEFDPKKEPIRSVLGSWLRRHDFDPEPAALLNALNQAIDDSEFSIGPSYFITPDGTEPDLESVWRHAIIPLLEERYYGSRRDVQREFGLEAMRRMASDAADSRTHENDQQPGQPPA
jgi:hypothetical protein